MPSTSNRPQFCCAVRPGDPAGSLSHPSQRWMGSTMHSTISDDSRSPTSASRHVASAVEPFQDTTGEIHGEACGRQVILEPHEGHIIGCQHCGNSTRQLRRFMGRRVGNKFGDGVSRKRRNIEQCGDISRDMLSNSRGNWYRNPSALQHLAPVRTSRTGAVRSASPNLTCHAQRKSAKTRQMKRFAD